MKKTTIFTTVALVALIAHPTSSLADHHEMMDDTSTMEVNMTANSTTSVDMTMTSAATPELKAVIKTRLEARSTPLTDMQIRTVLGRIEAFRDKMDASSLTESKKMAYNSILDSLEEVLKEMNGEIMMDELPTIAAAAMMKDEFSTLVVALQAANLTETLAGEGPFTVFAPDNAAFDTVDSETLAMLLEEENIEMLQEILTYHVVSGSYMASDITDGLMLETVNGAELTFTIVDGMVMIDGETTVTMADMVKSNGVVHKIDMVLMP